MTLTRKFELLAMFLPSRPLEYPTWCLGKDMGLMLPPSSPQQTGLFPSPSWFQLRCFRQFGHLSQSPKRQMLSLDRGMVQTLPRSVRPFQSPS
jgi:hypothetical protein